MTDNEIKKALAELRENQEDGYTTTLEYGGKRDIDHEKYLDLLGETLDLINRLQAENERLNTYLDVIGCSTDKIKAEAYKEFAELLKKHSYYDPKDQRKVVAEIIIDHYLKEKVGEDNA